MKEGTFPPLMQPPPAMESAGLSKILRLRVFNSHRFQERVPCLQINCTRDKFGNVTEGAPDEVTRVFYFWALQQDAAGFVGTDGKVYPPRWQLREMLVQGMMQLVS